MIFLFHLFYFIRANRAHLRLELQEAHLGYRMNITHSQKIIDFYETVALYCTDTVCLQFKLTRLEKINLMEVMNKKSQFSLSAFQQWEDGRLDSVF